MRRTLVLSAVVVGAMVAPVSAKEYPVEFKTLNAEEALGFGGGYGMYGRVRLKKPDAVKKEPKVVSKNALYGEMQKAPGSPAMVFRVDESKGTGMGHDRIIVDLNRNGDLTDDPVGDLAGSQASQQIRVFGPIQVKSRTVGPGQPIYYAQLNLYQSDFDSVRNNEDGTYMGNLRVKAAWYLEAVVDTDRGKCRLGLYDDNANVKLGDLPEPMYYPEDTKENWYFYPGDTLMVDCNNSGKFEDVWQNPETFPYNKIVYFGASPSKLTLAADCKSLAIDQWSEPVAELNLQPRGELVKRVSLAREAAPNKWELITPAVEGGKAKVPPGSYRLYETLVVGKAGDGTQGAASAYNRALKNTIKAEAGKSVEFTCGAPLDINVTTDDRSNKNVRINARVLGAGGEVFSRYGLGKNADGEPPRPKFTIADADGKQVESGNLEFG